MNHPISDESLKRFAAGSASRQENRSIVAHLLRGCAVCAQKVRESVRPEVPEDAYDSVLGRITGERTYRQDSWAKLLHFERPQAPAPVPVRGSLAR